MADNLKGIVHKEKDERELKEERNEIGKIV